MFKFVDQIYSRFSAIRLLGSIQKHELRYHSRPTLAIITELNFSNRIGVHRIMFRSRIPHLPAPRSRNTGAVGGRTGLTGDARGTVAVAFALAAPVLIGGAALAIDVSSWQSQRLAMQQSADQATVGAGVARQVGVNVTHEARAMAAANGFVHGVDGVSVRVDNPPLTGPAAGDLRAVEVTITKRGDVFFSGALRSAPPEIASRAVSLPKGRYSGGLCVMALATDGAGISLSGTGTIDAGNCNIYSNSTASNSVDLNGSATMRGYVVKIAGAIKKTGSGSVTATNSVQTGVAATADPYATRTIPSYSGCNAVAASLGAGAVVTAGATPYVFCNGLSISGSGTVTFNPGVYVIDRGVLNISSSPRIVATGGVTIILTSSTGVGYATLTMSGSPTMTIRAPSDGPTRGLAFWIDKRAVGSNAAIMGSASWNIIGAFYAPATTIGWNGGGTSYCTQIVGYRVSFQGSAGINNDCIGVGVDNPPGSIVPSVMALTE